MAHKTFYHKRGKQYRGNLLPSFFFLEIPKETLDTVCTNSVDKICKNNENSGDSFYDATNLLCTAGTLLEYPNTY